LEIEDMRWKYKSAFEIGGILLVVWLTLILILLFLDVYIVPLQLPIIGYVGRVITGITKVVIGVGFFIIWLFLWNYAVKGYFKRAIKTNDIAVEN
jgi:TM2 domain-containing membrane protein YozV